MKQMSEAARNIYGAETGVCPLKFDFIESTGCHNKAGCPVRNEFTVSVPGRAIWPLSEDNEIFTYMIRIEGEQIFKGLEDVCLNGIIDDQTSLLGNAYA